MRILTVLSLLFATHTFAAEPGICPDGRININEAPEAAFTKLKGVGEKKAAAIVADRATNGPFANVAALNRVKGVGDKSLENWAAQITTDCNAAAAADPHAGHDHAGHDHAAHGAEDQKAIDPAVAGALNLNTATAEQLGNLPGIGPKTAEAIIALRTQKGGAFKSIDELGEVKGIGAAKLEKLKPLVTFDPPAPIQPQ